MTRGQKPGAGTGTKSELLTTRAVAAMKPGEWAADPAARGAGRLQVRNLASGEAAWYYRYTGPDGDRVRLPLGTGLSLAEARRLASDLSRRYQSGDRDLRGALEAEQRAAERAQREAEAAEAREQARAGATLGLLLEAYADHLKAAGKPSHREVRRAIQRHVTQNKSKDEKVAADAKFIAGLRADQVTVDDVMPLFQSLTEAGKQREAEKLRSYFRAAFTAARKARHDAGMYAFKDFCIASNPLVDLEVTRSKETVEKAAQAAKERKWSLSEEQLRAYWKRINALPGPDGALLRFHLLTGGQRAEQLSRLTRDDHDADKKTVTLRDTKGRRSVAYDHAIPLIPDAVKALEAMRGDAGPHLFTVTEGMAPAGYHGLQHRMRAVAEAMVEAKEVNRVFTPGTIRKTVESRLQGKVSREVRGYLLSHGLGGVQAKHYETHEYDDEKREALEILRALLEPKKGKVVPFKRKGAKR